MKQKIQPLLSLSPERWFVIIALLFGTLFAFITPPFRVPDEYGHMARTYGISEGHIFATKQGDKSGSEVPLSLAIIGTKVTEKFALSDIPSLATIPLATNVVIFAEHPNTSLYSPLVYAPQALGFALSRTLNLPAISSFYVARLFNVLAYALLVYLAIRLLPIGKWIGVIVGLLPMHVMLSGSLSADPITIGLIALLVATVLWLRSLNRTIKPLEYVGLLALAAAIALGKLPYPLLLALFLFVPMRVMGGHARRWLYLAGLALCALLAGGGWLLAAKDTLVAFGPTGVNLTEQLNLVLTHPLGFLKAAFLTFFTPTSDGFVGQYVLAIGFLEYQLPLWITYLYGIFLAFAVVRLRTDGSVPLTRRQKIITALLGATIVGVITLLLYVSWTPVGKPVVDGFQARYFTPLLFLLIPLFAIRSLKSQSNQGSLSPMWYQYVPVLFLTAGLAMSVYFFYLR